MFLAMQVPFTPKCDFFFRFKNASKILLWSYTDAVVTHPFVIHSRHLLPSAPECQRKHSYSSWWALPLTKDAFCRYFLPSSSNPAASCLKVAVLNTRAEVSQSMAVSPVTGRISTLLLRLLNKMQGIKLSKRLSSKKPDDFMERSCPVSKLSCVGQRIKPSQMWWFSTAITYQQCLGSVFPFQQ